MRTVGSHGGTHAARGAACKAQVRAIISLWLLPAPAAAAWRAGGAAHRSRRPPPHPSSRPQRAPPPCLRRHRRRTRVQGGGCHRGRGAHAARGGDGVGRFVPQRFDDAFSKYASAKTGAGAPAMTWADVRAMVAGNACARDVFGRAANFLEWSGLFFVAAQQATPDGDSGPHVLTRERARQAMDGSLWPALEREAAARRAAVATRRGAAWWAPWARGWGGRAGAAHAE